MRLLYHHSKTTALPANLETSLNLLHFFSVSPERLLVLPYLRFGFPMATTPSPKVWSPLKLFRNLTTYSYDPLPNETSFRILELLPGKSTDAVKVKLRTADFNDEPKYEAISYCWGSIPDSPPRIRIGQRRLAITPSLHSALVHLRYSDKPRMLWADAVW
jgi:hypothetical protein